MVAGSYHDPGDGGQRSREDEGHPGAQPLVYGSTSQAADDVANEEQAGDPRAKEEVDLYGIVRGRALHHLWYRHAREGEPAANNRRSKGHSYGSK